MGSAAICSKTNQKNNYHNNNKFKIFSKSLNNYLKSGRNKKLLTNVTKDKNNIFSPRNNNNLSNELNNGNETNEYIDNLVFQPQPGTAVRNEVKEKFNSYLKTGKLPASNLTETLNANNLLKISFELLSANQQAKIKSINHINLFNCVTFPRILNDINIKDSVQVIEKTEISEKTNFRIIYNKNMHDKMNNLFFPEEFIMQQRNTINFSANSISFRDLPVPSTQLNVTTSYINGGPGHMMEISNLNNLNFNTQPNDDLFMKRRANNFTNFNRKIKNYFMETDKISSSNDTSSHNIGSINFKNKDSIASKTLQQLYDKVFMRNSIKNTAENQTRISSLLNSNPMNSSSYLKSFSPKMDIFKRASILSKNFNYNNKSFVNNLPKTALYTIEDCNYDYNTSGIMNNFETNTNEQRRNIDVNKCKQPTDKLARKLYYSYEVRSRILERKEKENELMMRSLSALEEEYNQLQEEINPIFNIKNAIDDSNYNNNVYDSKRNMKYLNTNDINNKNKDHKNSKKEPLFEINIKDLIKETINERIITENNKDKASEKSKIIKFKNLNINNININIQTNNTEGNYSTIYRKKPKTNSYENAKENFIINASSEFINSIETFTNINNTHYDKRNSSKINSIKKNEKSKNLNNNYYKKNFIGYSNKSLKNKYSDMSSSKKIDSSEAEKRRKATNNTFAINNNYKSKTNINKTKEINAIINKNQNNTNFSSSNCENIFSKIVIESPLISKKKSIGDLYLNKISSDNNFENLNTPTRTLPERNSMSITNNNIDSINNANVETDYQNMNIDKKLAFTLQKNPSNSLISKSKSFTESDSVSSFDSKELMLKDFSAENNTNFRMNKSKDKDSNNILTQGNSEENFQIGNPNKIGYVSCNNINVNNENRISNLETKEMMFDIKKRQTMINALPKFNMSK